MSRVPEYGERTCTRCGWAQPVQRFRVFRIAGDPDREYRRSWCGTCEIAYAREWRKRHPEYHRAKSRYYRSL